MFSTEKSSCGVGFIASLHNQPDHSHLEIGLKALAALEHRGGSSFDLLTSDGAGIMTDIPHDLFGIPPTSAVASLFLPRSASSKKRCLEVFEATFKHLDLEIILYRKPLLNSDVLSKSCEKDRPEILMIAIARPEACTTRFSFEKKLYTAKQMTRSRLRGAGLLNQLFFTSLSAATLVYKALTPSHLLSEFYLDLKNSDFKTRFSLFHRRFNTNTATSWDRVQPFRILAHNGEINTISGNRAWAYARERALGIQEDELLTHRGISDSGSVNEMLEALMCRSSIPHVEDILAIMMPQADSSQPFYKFWSRAMEPWDGPALFTFSDGRTIGARLDRSGFRPCRWARTADHFFLSSEAGSFGLLESKILAKGALSGGSSVSIDLVSGKVRFEDPADSRENKSATFDPRLTKLERFPEISEPVSQIHLLKLFNYTEEDVNKIIFPTVKDGKEPIGSMGDTASLAVLSNETRSLFDYFYQNFAQVTNPPLDYLREKMVTDMSVVLGRKPNIFEPKELLPLKRGLELEGPVLSLKQMEFLKNLNTKKEENLYGLDSEVLEITFSRHEGVNGFISKIAELREQAVRAVKKKKSILILSERSANESNAPIPSVFILSALTQALNDCGMRLRTSLVVDTGEVRTTHHLSVLMGFGASAVCPYLALELARSKSENSAEAEICEKSLILALEAGLLKVMSKMGVSVLQSYQGSSLFSIIGFGAELHKQFFPNHRSFIGGLNLETLVDLILKNSSESFSKALGPSGLNHHYLFREHPRDAIGERHSMTTRRSRVIHQLVKETGLDLRSPELFESYLKMGEETEPMSIRHLLKPKSASKPLALDQVEAKEKIFSRWGSGAMSFGAISAESQRDIIQAMNEIGARSNSGEGGENPFYFVDGTRAHTKQIASARFGVTSEYLVNGSEVQIKMAQGAKPGEGGQLMACKVGPDTARARYSEENVDLISPPPMHDIYSIEDLKELIYELRQLNPSAKISVKLVSGDSIGTIAVGVVKAGADIVHIAGHDGGTGAATLSSMKHAGLPWELGLEECHRFLLEAHLRHRVTLRVDGGMSSGRDVVIAAILGADEFDFGKLLLVAEGCIMARICEKNTCPTGIATHDPKFKKLYKGSKEKIIKLLHYLADDVRRELAELGVQGLSELIGRADLLELHPKRKELIQSRGFDLSLFLKAPSKIPTPEANPFIENISDMNHRILKEVEALQDSDLSHELNFQLKPSDRAILATLNGKIGLERAAKKPQSGRMPFVQIQKASSFDDRVQKIKFRFAGSAGQGFGVFTQSGLNIHLEGEANDSVAKGMSGGKMVVVPSAEALFSPEENSIIGNCALYGSTGGTLYVSGLAGDRFAVRNSGATAIVEGVGIQACEYMTRGRVFILGRAGVNIGAGMTGGYLFISRENLKNINETYVRAHSCSDEDFSEMKLLLEDFFLETKSTKASALLKDWESHKDKYIKIIPKPRELSTHLNIPSPHAIVA
ncbi:MAG: hypothetical protein JWQ35_1733 [Bacteriovoracaceae bacterium]|nr:hypothetical protein [Bacteriovoracaceae bacterium]